MLQIKILKKLILLKDNGVSIKIMYGKCIKFDETFFNL